MRRHSERTVHLPTLNTRTGMDAAIARPSLPPAATTTLTQYSTPNFSFIRCRGTRLRMRIQCSVSGTEKQSAPG